MLKLFIVNVFSFYIGKLYLQVNLCLINKKEKIIKRSLCKDKILLTIVILEKIHKNEKTGQIKEGLENIDTFQDKFLVSF